jgi:hypothetical protein
VSVNSATLVGTGTDAQAVFEEMDDAIAALVAGAGIPGATFDGKGEILVGSANDAYDNLAAGTNNHVLTADSAQTLGVKWSAPVTVATDTIWDAQGDIVVATAADTAARLALGASGTMLRSNGTTLAYAVPPGTELDFAQGTATVTIAATTAAGATTIITGAGFTSDGTRHKVECFIPQLQVDQRGVGTGGSQARFNVYEGSTDLGRVATWTVQDEIATAEPLICYGVKIEFFHTPSSGSRTYSIRAWKNAAGALASACTADGVGGGAPYWIRVTKA